MGNKVADRLRDQILQLHSQISALYNAQDLPIPFFYVHFVRGVPQGSILGPSIANLLLSNAFPKNILKDMSLDYSLSASLCNYSLRSSWNRRKCRLGSRSCPRFDCYAAGNLCHRVARFGAKNE